MNLKNLSFYFAIAIILVVIIVLKKTASDPTVMPTKNSNSAATDVSTTESLNSNDGAADEEVNFDQTNTNESASSDNDVAKENPYAPDYELAKKELMQNPELAKEAQKSVYPFIVEGVKKELKSKEEAERIMGLLQICMTDATVAQNTEVQANCVMGAREIVKKFPELNENLETQVLKYASPEVKALADKLSSQE